VAWSAVQVVPLLAALAAIAPPVAAGAPGPAPTPNDAALALALQDPLSGPTRVPIAIELDRDIGADRSGRRITLALQPVVPIVLGPRWTMVSHTRVPLITQDGVPGQVGGGSGLGDVLQTLLFVPSAGAPRAAEGGIGPVLLVPTASEESLGARQWAAGPAAAITLRHGDWIGGAQAHRLWSFAGNHDRADIDETRVRPFVAWTPAPAWTLALDADGRHDRITGHWSVPVTLQATRLTQVAGTRVALGAGLTRWTVSPDDGPQGWGLRLTVTLLPGG
jgi:hypothetical protein